MSLYAITPRGVGKIVGARTVEDNWPLEHGETFKVTEWSKTMVLAEDSMSLREGTPDELAPLPPPPNANLRIDAGIAASLVTAVAASTIIHAIPQQFNATNFNALLAQMKITMDAFVNMLQAQAAAGQPPQPPAPPP